MPPTNLSRSFQPKTYSLGNDDHYLIRSIQADDREHIIGLFNHLSPENRFLRFAHAISKLPDEFLDDILYLDYQTEMALVAVIHEHAQNEEVIGIARYVSLPGKRICEFSLSVSDSHTAHGVGTHLMLDLIAHAKENLIQEVLGYVLRSNSKMLHLVTDLGFQITKLDDDQDFKTVSLLL
jgi:acetyltransferase